ncbi:hypothetical protein [Pseudorhodoferax sp. Leaf267]|uniref:hypothetical protein n=1 Tax=Pseudorhodoferax sp. Leaf267 TaxID=1736316 RepID=UPI0006F3B630|nr:hypothetical protein [Pseudorhodoferax sp. Leaf267]KQP22530.1 hypothetical protein ASF43_00975 [Pseudorhodoferax sp. Leaf267]
MTWLCTTRARIAAHAQRGAGTHAGSSLKHWLARPPCLVARVNGTARGGTTLVAACSGSTAVRAACLARLLSRAAGQQGSILSLLCGAGARCLTGLHDAGWVATQRGHGGPAQRRIAQALAT